MKVNELQFGNIIYSLGQRHENGRMLEWINYEIPVDLEVLQNIISKNTDFEYSPIPLTEEWLLKFGFKEVEGFFVKGHLKLLAIRDLYWRANYPIIFDVIHVHQLQNLYFALTGEELLK